MRRIAPATAASLLLCAGSGPAIAAEDPFAALLQESRPLATRWQTDYSGYLEVGAAWVSDDNFMFGQYNGLNEDEVTAIANMAWSGRTGSGRWLEASGTDLGLDTRSGGIRWGQPGRFEFGFEFDSQLQVRNNTGRTPFLGGDNRLPADWVSSNITSGFTALDSGARGLDQEIERDIYRGFMKGSFSDSLDISAELSYEEKTGTADWGAAIWPNISSGHAAIVPLDVDYETTEFELAVDYHTDKLQLNGSWFYSGFDNNNDLVLWQNPYDVFGPAVAYPEGDGGMAQAPDNDQNRLRLLGTYIVSPTLRLQVDGSYATTDQDQAFADYSVNPQLQVFEPLPRSDLDASVDTYTLDTRVFFRPLPKLNIEAWYHGEEKDYDGPRDSYRQILGDATDQVESELALWNTWHDYTVNKTGIEASYRLPWRSKVWLGYEYVDTERRNAAVEDTEEDLYSLRYRIRALSSLTATLDLLYGDRAADTYQWDQFYYARLDAGLINQTPENQRYTNHPLLSQYYLSNRERGEARLDLSWQASQSLQLVANLLYRVDDYDKSDLGLTDEDLERYSLTASWMPNNRLTLSAWASFDRYETQQGGRSFRGGIEKNAFDTVPPLAQASDPTRDWDMDGEDEAINVGLAGQWQLSEALDINFDYSYVDSESSYDFNTGGAPDLDPESWPDNSTTQHHFTLQGAWHLREALTINFDYQYWSFEADDWSIHDITPTTIDKVLTLGEQEADEDLHYVGTSIVYRWQ